MRVLVTGGAGFIGSHLVGRLVKKNHKVVVVDNLSTGRRKNVDAKASLIELDLSRPGFVRRLPVAKFDAVCHLAAQSSGEISGQDPAYDFRANAESTLLLSRWCVQKGISRFLYASSMAVYGNPVSNPVSEEAHCAPLSYYGVSKAASEEILRLAGRDGLQSTCFRMFNVYGPGQNMKNLKQGMLSIYLAYLLKGVSVPVTGSLDRFRDFVFIDDVVDAWMEALACPSTPSLVYNLGTGRATKVRELLNLLMKSLGKPGHPIRELPGSPADQFGLTADIARVKKELRWTPRTTLSEGISTMVAWAR